MPFDLHTVEVPDGCLLNDFSKLVFGAQVGIANLAGSGAGASVTTAVAFPGGLPAKYFVSVQPSQNCFVTVTSKTTTGFSVVMTPTSGSVTLAAGTFDVAVIG